MAMDVLNIATALVQLPLTLIAEATERLRRTNKRSTHENEQWNTMLPFKLMLRTEQGERITTR